MGYISFIALTVNHFHGDTFNSNYKTIGLAHTNSCATTSESQENCQICHLYSSINVTSIGIKISSGILVENCVVINIDPGFSTNFTEVNYLRGPPSDNILFI